MDTYKLQKVLVESANKKIKDILEEYCQNKYHSSDYFSYIKANLNAKVLEIPNPQLWVEDDYVTNSTNFSMLNIAKEPRTFCQQAAKQNIPIDEPNFGENEMGSTHSPIFYERYLAECENVIRLMESYYPTHTIEIHDFGFALSTLWIKTTYSLLKKVEERYKSFFTHRMINQFITSLAYDAEDVAPNIKLITYDSFGLAAQGVEWKRRKFKHRFNNDTAFITLCTHDAYQSFMSDFLSPLRSLKSIRAGCSFPCIEFREIEEFDDEVYRDIQGLLMGQMDSLNPILHTAFFMLANKTQPLPEVLKILKEKIPPATYKRIEAHLSKNKERTDLVHKYNFLEKNIKTMEKRGITFAKYNCNTPLLPPANTFSEVILNMDKFKKQYPSQTKQQFTEVFLMAQTINACRRTFIKKYPRNDWNLCVRIKGCDTTPYPDTLKTVLEKLTSEELDNYTVMVG